MVSRLALRSFFFASLAIAQYCIPGPTQTVDTNLGAVTLTGDTPPGIVDSTNCPGVAGIRDLTYLLAELSIGKTYQLTFNITFCSLYTYPALLGAWIDYNSNFQFEPTELLFYSNVSQTANFTVPETANLGNTRLRVQVQETSTTSLNPCAIFSYGGTKDYSVSIKTPAPEFCLTGPSSGNDMNLGPVSLTGFTESFVDNTDCPSVIGGADLTDLIADVNAGSQYTLNLKVTSCAPEGSLFWATTSAAWIDYNQDKNFDTWERIGTSQLLETGDVALTFTVPTSIPEQEVVPGNTRMRVQTQETNAEDIYPCTQFAWGGTKDFTVRIRPYIAYCVSGPTSTSRYALGQVTLIGVTTNIMDPGVCPPPQTGPIDYTNMIADAYIQGSYTLTYDVINCDGGTSATMSAAWVDYNHNGLLEAWEQITPRSSAFGTVTYTFKVPPSSPNQQVMGGPTRLRISVQVNGVAPLDPCAAFPNGGTKDFTLNIISPASNQNTTETIVNKRGPQKRIISVTRH